MLLALGTMALAGLAYSSGSTLLGGWLSNRRQVKNQQDNQRFQGELAVKQQEFQKAQTEKNFVQSAELQREITELKAALDRQMQEERFNQNIDMWERSHFIDQVWPLINTPQGYVDYLKQIGCPMSVIVTGKLEDKLSNVLASASGFINTHYANQKQIYYYNQGWKENMRTRQGNAQRDAIHQGLSGLPTLVVMPDIENGDFKLDVAFWGFGESIPQTVSVFKRNYQQMEMEVLRNIAQEWNDRPLPSTSNPKIMSIKANIEIAKKQEEYRRILRAEKKYSEEQIEQMCDEIYASEYKKTGLEADVARGISQLAGAPIAIASGLYADAFLLGTGNAPKLPTLLKEFPMSIQKDMEKQIGIFYVDLIQKIDVLDRPKACALIAQAYAQCGDTKVAQQFQMLALKDLQGYYGNRSRQIARPHWEAVEIIRKAPLCKMSEFPYLLRDAKAPQFLLSASR
ncbi:MAG: hypothetical protein IJD43_04490 [Thermoguttaceae bacterium]|nr:hypothetical protein [Planctomycetaceae bacterium]MBQ4142716.1 hypothetical protein [Thermoguttaceae bacterium]